MRVVFERWKKVPQRFPQEMQKAVGSGQFSVPKMPSSAVGCFDFAEHDKFVDGSAIGRVQELPERKFHWPGSPSQQDPNSSGEVSQ